MTVPSPSAISKYGTLLMLFGAARADGTPEQVARIRDEALPLLRDPDAPLASVVTTVFGIMGDEWSPQGEWLDAIKNLAR